MATPSPNTAPVAGAGSLLSKTITRFGPGNGTTRWQPQAFTFMANSNAATLAFRDLSTSTNALDLTLDNVRITVLQSAPAAAALATPDTSSGHSPGSPAITACREPSESP